MPVLREVMVTKRESVWTDSARMAPAFFAAQSPDRSILDEQDGMAWAAWDARCPTGFIRAERQHGSPYPSLRQGLADNRQI